MNKKFKSMVDGLSNDELWIMVHFYFNHPEKSLDEIFASWNCGDCADFEFCDKKSSPPQCANEAAKMPRLILNWG